MTLGAEDDETATQFFSPSIPHCFESQMETFLSIVQLLFDSILQTSAWPHHQNVEKACRSVHELLSPHLHLAWHLRSSQVWEMTSACVTMDC